MRTNKLISGALGFVSMLFILAACSAAESGDVGGTLPPAAPGNAPIGAVPEDEPPISGATYERYVQEDTRTPIEYKGTSN